MKANESNFGFMQNEELIIIPFFQRAYVWKEEQWEQFFDDLLESFKRQKEHFLGSIILKQLTTNAGEGSKRSLIDGQQRLTSFSILVKALYDKLDDGDKADYANYLYRRPTKDKNAKIEHSKIDKISFDRILKATNFNSIEKNEKSRLHACYQYFTIRVEGLEESRKFLDYILNSQLWVVINLEKDEDEQQIFDSINSTGVKLTASDIIKNALFDKAIALETNYEELYKEYWEDIFEVENTIDFWQEELSTGRVKRTRSEIFLHAFAVIEGFFDADSSLEYLSNLYKEQIKNFNKDSLKKFLQKLKEYALIYQDFPKIDKNMTLNFKNPELKLFHILKITETNTIAPLLLKLKAILKDKENLHLCFKLLECFILYRWLCASTTKGYNKIFAKLAQIINKNNAYDSILNNLKDEIPKQDKVKESLISKDFNIKNGKATLVLFWIELYRRFKNKNKQDIIELCYEYTLEHLMPQKWQNNWENIGQNEEYARSLIYQIGNMTLLTRSLNSTIKNSSWKIKLNGNGKEDKYIKSCADLLITKELLDIEQWNEEEISKRTERLIKEFFEIWNIENY
ncbi:hypothetical protein CQA38_03470 [Campylobacter sp. MIT 12-5580]|uniref:DUF262 domain-containing protein n=1 Tax=Campylobacter sp. MIT 12-5580 TaxID=2040651 RepID=UPI0010F71AFE|nr:DUF262 domain-containing protein [Campylobacter sp. MIT 12-5580]TKX29837.1 hypothetical protein CQA38_03470 [Campylobacter sp. MIT 12-5580]